MAGPRKRPMQPAVTAAQRHADRFLGDSRNAAAHTLLPQRFPIERPDIDVAKAVNAVLLKKAQDFPIGPEKGSTAMLLKSMPSRR